MEGLTNWLIKGLEISLFLPLSLCNAIGFPVLMRKFAISTAVDRDHPWIDG
jgi:hypothetical protein